MTRVELVQTSPRAHQLWRALITAENLVYTVESALDDATSLQKALEGL